MLIIHRSIVKELLFSFLLSLLFLNFTLMMEKLLRLSRILSGVGASLLDIARIIILLQPQLLILTIPMAMLLAVLLTYGRMNADSELVVLRGSGLSFRGIARPVVYLGAACFTAALAMSFYLGPKGSAAMRQGLVEILTRRAPMTIEEGIFNTAFKDIVILVREKPSADRLSGIFIVDERNKAEQKVIVAEGGRLTPEGDTLGFSLEGGRIYITKEHALTEIAFRTYHFTLTPSVESSDKKSSELTPLELLSARTESPEKAGAYLLEFHRRLSMPALCLVLILLGPALSLMAGRSGRLGGLTVGLGVFVAYYTLLLYGENLARTGALPYAAGAWLSFVVLAGAAVLVFERVSAK